MIFPCFKHIKLEKMETLDQVAAFQEEMDFLYTEVVDENEAFFDELKSLEEFYMVSE